MQEQLDYFIFGIMPYIALTVLIVGSIARYERDPYTWKSSSSQLLRRKQLVWGSILFHVGIITVFGGHLVGLFTPVAVLDALGIPYVAKQVSPTSAFWCCFGCNCSSGWRRSP